MKNIAIYLTNTDRSDFAARHPNDAEKVIQLLRVAKAEYAYTIYDVTKEEIPDEGKVYDAVILTGSPAFIDDDDRWIELVLDEIRRLNAMRTPMVGLCFGHQAIIHALGGRVDKMDEWLFGAAQFEIRNTPEWMSPPKRDMKLYAANKAQATSLPRGMEVLGGAPECPFALTQLGDHILTTQFHPEMSDGFIAALVEQYSGYLGEELTAVANEQINGGADGALFGQWVRNFIDMRRLR